MSKKYDKAAYASKKSLGQCAAHGCNRSADGRYVYCVAHRKYFADQATRTRMTRPERAMMAQAKKRAKLRGIPFNLTIQDISIPRVCPVLGIPMERGQGVGGMVAGSPSLDCFLPAIGYVAGNVTVISYRANRIKCDASLDELEKITAWVRRGGQ